MECHLPKSYVGKEFQRVKPENNGDAGDADGGGVIPYRRQIGIGHDPREETHTDREIEDS